MEQMTSMNNLPPFKVSIEDSIVCLDWAVGARVDLPLEVGQFIADTVYASGHTIDIISYYHTEITKIIHQLVVDGTIWFCSGWWVLDKPRWDAWVEGHHIDERKIDREFHFE